VRVGLKVTIKLMTIVYNSSAMYLSIELSFVLVDLIHWNGGCGNVITRMTTHNSYSNGNWRQGEPRRGGAQEPPAACPGTEDTNTTMYVRTGKKDSVSTGELEARSL